MIVFLQTFSKKTSTDVLITFNSFIKHEIKNTLNDI